MNTEKILSISAIILGIILMLSTCFYAGMVFEFSNVCPAGENFSILFGGQINSNQFPELQANINNTEYGGRE